MSEKTVKIVVAGDLFPRYRFDLLSSGEAERVFSKEILELFRGADISFCNLEGALTDGDTKIAKCGPIIKAPTGVAKGLKDLGLTCVSLGNNHALDYGKKGYEDTCAALENVGIQYFGAGKNIDSLIKYLMFTVNGKRICLYSVADVMFNIPDKDHPGAHLYDEYRVCGELAKLREQCDCLIVFYHGGTQYFRYPTEKLIRHFHRMADNGADIVVANHTHCIGTKEIYNGAYLLYGQGNFLFYNNRPGVSTDSLLLEILIGEDGKPQITEHYACHDGNKVWLEPEHDLSDYEERNRRLAAGETFDAEYSAACAVKYLMFLRNMRGHSFFDRVMHTLLPEKLYRRYLRKQYRQLDILRIIEILRCEEINEVMTQAMIDYLDAET